MKPMRTAKVLAKLEKAGCSLHRISGRHQVWICGCGRHRVPVPATHKQVSPGVIRELIKELPCLGKGWLQ